MSIWTTKDIPSQAGKLAVVTGANSGVGWHTALELARAGATVIVAARSETKGLDALKRIEQCVPRAKVRYEHLDLADLFSIQAFANRMNGEIALDLLVNNAGVMRIPQRELTCDGFEKQLGTNFLGPFALTLRLLPVLRRAPAPRVTTVGSNTAKGGLRKINFDDLQGENIYGPWNAYCQSKLAALLFMQELGRRTELEGKRILSNSGHPGWAMTNLQSSGPGRELNWFENFVSSLFAQDAAGGSLPTLRAATALDTRSGDYFGPSGRFELKGPPILRPLPEPAQDANVAKRLWLVAESLTGVSLK